MMAQAAGTLGDYADQAPRYCSCHTCHMRPTTGKGCDKNSVPVRTDLPLYDLNGGTIWMPGAIAHLDSVDKLRLGGGMSPPETMASAPIAVPAPGALLMLAAGIGFLAALGRSRARP